MNNDNLIEKLYFIASNIDNKSKQINHLNNEIWLLVTEAIDLIVDYDGEKEDE